VGNVHVQGDGAQAELRRGREEAIIQKHVGQQSEDYRPRSYLARLREADAPWEKELAAQAIGEAFGASHGELLLESTLGPNEAAQVTHNSASIFKTTGDVAGA